MKAIDNIFTVLVLTIGLILSFIYGIGLGFKHLWNTNKKAFFMYSTVYLTIIFIITKVLL